jgi:hypothetical protein
MSSHKYYINDIEYTPINRGAVVIETTRERENGSYQYVKSLATKLKFGNADGAYSYIEKHGECQELIVRIVEFCQEFPAGIDIYRGKFTRRKATPNDPDSQTVEIDPTEKSFYQALKDNYDRNFNFLEAPTVVESVYAEDISVFEYAIIGGVQRLTKPFFGTYVQDTIGGSPIFGVSVFARETITTYCQGGEPQAPPQGVFAQWELLVNNCVGKSLSTWFRKPNAFQPALVPALVTTVTICVGALCVPPFPPVTVADEIWVLMDTGATSAPVGNISFWIDQNSIQKTIVNINNGRELTDVINLGLNRHEETKELDLQSQFLFNIISPVTGLSPSPQYKAQVHAISDVKFPDASEPASNEKTNLRDLFSGIIEGRYNAFWRVNEGTKRLIIEHIKDLNNQGVIDLTAIDGGKWMKQKNKYEYNNSDVPKAEEFPSLDVSIDFTGVDIDYDNACASGKKSYQTDKYYSEVQLIISDPDSYPSDGIVLITPDSLAPENTTDNGVPIGFRSENGAITGDYRPNAPQSMANLQEELWGYYRPFPSGVMNFIPRVFEKAKPIKNLESVTIPICCFFLFEPTSEFVGNTFTDGQLVSSSYHLASNIITLNLEY